MEGDLHELPDDPAVLKAMIADMRRSNTSLEAEVAALKTASADAQARIDRLQLLLKTIQRATYGRSSEKLDESQYAFAFEEVQTGLGAVEAKLEKLGSTPARKSGGRRPLPAHLERIEEIIEPEERACSCGACARVKIGEDVSERLDVVAPKFQVIVTRRPRYACQACRESIVQAPAPARLIEGGIATERLLAGIAVSKYADGLPLYRQEAIFARDKVELGRNLMLIFDTLNFQTIDYKRELALEKRRGTTFVAGGAVQASATWRTVDGRATPVARSARLAAGSGRRAQQETLAVLFDFGLGQGVEVYQNVGPGDARRRSLSQPARRGRRCDLPVPFSGRAQGSCTRRGRGWSRRVCDRSGGFRTGSWRFERSVPPSTNACRRAWLRAATGGRWFAGRRPRRTWRPPRPWRGR